MELKNEIITKLTDRFNESKNTVGFPEENKVLVDACLKVAVKIIENACDGNQANSENANCAIFDVSQQRELLIAFLEDYHQHRIDVDITMIEYDVDKYLSNL